MTEPHLTHTLGHHLEHTDFFHTHKKQEKSLESHLHMRQIAQPMTAETDLNNTRGTTFILQTTCTLHVLNY